MTRRDWLTMLLVLIVVAAAGVVAFLIGTAVAEWWHG